MKWSKTCEVVRRRAKTLTFNLYFYLSTHFQLSLRSAAEKTVSKEIILHSQNQLRPDAHAHAHARAHRHAHTRTHTHTHAHTQTCMQVRTLRRHTPSSMRQGLLVFCKLSVRGSSYCGTLRMLFLDWGEWTECSEPCQTPTATGTQYRRRFCFDTGRNKSCGKFQGVCNVKPCDGKCWQLNM